VSIHRRSRAAALGLTVGALAAASLVVAPSAAASTSGVVINEVYGGGGNAGATLQNDFIELRNTTDAAIDISGWSVQYASATGNSWTNRTTLNGSIPAGGTYLISGAGGTTGAPLPTPDVTGGINLAGTAGKVALVTNTTALACGSVASGTCIGKPGVEDFVGYGATATDSETAPAPAPSNSTSVTRNAAGLDTDRNSADFAAGAPSPANSKDETAGGGTPPPPPPPATQARIPQIQGTGHTSPIVGTTVATSGVVTGRANNGFWIQDPTGDGDPTSSDGIFVFTSSAPPATAAVGAGVTVTGTVSEFSGRAGDLTVTQLGSPTVTAAVAMAPVTPTVVGPGGLTPPGTVIDDDGLATVDPVNDGADFYESLEGMLLSLDTPQAVGPTNGFGELPVVVGDASVRTGRGGIIVRDTDGQVDGSAGDYVTGDFNPERIILDDRIIGAGVMPAANVGATLAGTVLGVLDYGFGNPKLQVTAVPTVASNPLQRETAAAPGAEDLAVATFNVENLDPTDPQQKFDDLATVIVANMQAPDLLALEEIQDDNGAPANNGIVTAGQTLDRLVAAITAAGGPTYEYRQIDPEYGTDGGAPGGNIRVGFLFRTDRGLGFVDRPGGDATSATQVTGSGASTALTLSPGRIAPTDAAWANSRKPLAGEFTYRGESYFVIVNHFASKGGDQALYGANQPPVRSSEVQRHRQAEVLGTFVGQLLSADPQANVIALGDLNDYQFSGTMRILERTSGLKNLMETLPVEEQYTYVFDGNSQSLDHTLVSPALLAGGLTYDPVHVNSEFADQVSDHDPQLALIDTAVAATATISDDRPLRGDEVTVTGTGFAPGQTVTAKLSSRSTPLGSAVAGADGTGSITFTVPVLLPQGKQEVVVTAGDGEKASTSFTLRPVYQDVLQRILRFFTTRR
jgi:predicted extracellular nuclease